MEIVTGTAGNAMINIAISVILQQMNEYDFIILDENRQVLETQLNRMRHLLLNIRSRFEDQQREAPAFLVYWLERMQREVGKGTELIHRTQRAQKRFHAILFRPGMARQIREWKTTSNEIFNELDTDLSLFCSAEQTAMYASRHEEGVLLQDIPDTGLIGKEIKDAETQLQSWISEAPHVPIIGVHGTGGVGKTTLLKKVYNNFKVGNIFDHVIWVTVGQSTIRQMQNDIASVIHLDLGDSGTDMQKMKLSAYMKTKKFFLVLDDLWSAVDPNDMGVEFGENKGSKLVFTSQNKDLIGEMNAKQSMQIRPLLPKEAWELFGKVAFEDGHVPKHIENIARQVAEEYCEGLPLAITAIASRMRGNTAVDEWKLALNEMHKIDLSRIDQTLYLQLRRSYDRLPNANLRNCFLCCAMFPREAKIDLNDLLEMWMGENLIQNKLQGRKFVQFLVYRCLFQSVGLVPHITVRNALRDITFYIGEYEEKCVFKAGQSLEHFPNIPCSDECKRISVRGNNIKSLPAKELGCPMLVNLNLHGNEELKKIPEEFLFRLASLSILDVSKTNIESLPASLWQLRKLRYLNLSYTKIEEMSPSISDLSELQFLYLVGCSKLERLPKQIGNLLQLMTLSIRDCHNIGMIPVEIVILPKCNIIRN